MRLFVALAPPAAAVAHLDSAWAPVRALHPGLRWTSAEAWHVTLAFLGEVSEDRLPRLLPRLERAAGRHVALGLSFTGAGAFPSPRRATVLWTGIAGDHRALAQLAASVSAAARRAGAAPPDEGRRFRPHVTLARCRAPVNLTVVVASRHDYAGPSWTAGEICLIRSRLGESPRYETLGAYRLRALRLAELLQDGSGGAERRYLLRGQLLHPLRQPGLLAAADAVDERTAFWRHREDDLPAVGRVRGALHEAAFLQHRDHPRHRRRLHLLVLGQLARSHRLMALERR